MRETLLARLVLVLSRATPEELAAVYRFATEEALPGKGLDGQVPQVNGECQLAARRGLRALPVGKGSEAAPSEVDAKVEPAYVFRWTRRDWEVVFGGGRAFHLPSFLGARYLDYHLHRPNQPISAFAPEVPVGGAGVGGILPKSEFWEAFLPNWEAFLPAREVYDRKSEIREAIAELLCSRKRTQRTQSVLIREHSVNCSKG
jgi:hypothetical protein